MVPVKAVVTASDSCGGTVTIKLDSILSSEPDDAVGTGDGHTFNDIQGASFGTADYSFALRAERAGGGPGRTYTITYVATSTSGSSASTSAQVFVPPSNGKGSHPHPAPVLDPDSQGNKGSKDNPDRN
jgi:endo-1,4-beta-xylanase